MPRNSRKDWAAYAPEEIPTKTAVPELEAFLVEVGEYGRLLDLGCGRGRISRMLAERGFDVTGVDINEKAIERARGDGGPSFHVRDVAAPEGLRLPEAPYRIVVCQLVISVIGSVRERNALLENAFDVLEPGGFLYLSASEVSDDINPSYRKLYQDDHPETMERHTYFSRDGAGNVLYTTHHFTAPELSALIEDTGFDLVRVTSTTETSSRRAGEAAHFLYAVARRPGRKSGKETRG